MIHHSDRGGQYLSIRYTERLAEARIEPSVGSVGDSDDTALAETINGLYKVEVLRSDSERVAERAKATDVDLQLKVFPCLWHVFQLFVGMMSAATRRCTNPSRGCRHTGPGHP